MRPSPEQAAIVEHPLEPVRVAAGAGTGKTTTMAMRIRHLVDRGAVVPERVLGITFTNKAATELASRIRHHLPEATATGREVEVTTYHGFAHGIVREFGPLVGLPRDAAVVPPGYVRQLLREAIETVDIALMDLTAPGHRVDELARLAAALGDNLLEPEALAEGDADDEVWRRRREMARVLESYATRKRELGLVDFGDLVRIAHRLCATDASLSARIRDRYRAVFLDEYQDTNPAQRRLLQTLFGDGFPVTAVGDADQTIYEWRGASLQNFERFPDHFPTGDGRSSSTLPLSVNRRSGRSILRVAEAIRSELDHRGPLDELVPGPGAEAGEVTTRWFHSAVDEARWIADEVVRRHDEDGRRWNDIAILFRRHRSIGLVRDALDRAGVPVEVASLGGLLDVPEVADLHAWLRLLARPDDAPALARILLGSRYRLGLGDLAPLSSWLRGVRTGHHDDVGPGWALLEAVDRLDEIEAVDADARQRLDEFRAVHRDLLMAAQNVDLVELCRRVLDGLDTWTEVDALEPHAALSARLNLYRFLDLAEEWSPLEGRPSLIAFVDYLDLLREDVSNDALDTATVSGEDAVVLVTVHRSKGLEWPIVILPSLVADTFPSRVIRFEDPVTRPQYLPLHLRLDHDPGVELPSDEDARKAHLRRNHLDQEWRTAYVAATRARETLIGTGAFWYTESKPRRPSRLYEIVDAVAGGSEVPEDPGRPPNSLRFEVETDGAPDPLFEHGWLEALRGAVDDPETPRRIATRHGVDRAYDAAVDQLRMTLDGLPEPEEITDDDSAFRTSVTGLVTYAICPKRFYWSEIDRLPRRPSAGARRGIELHRKIELHNRGSVTFDDADETFYDAVDATGPDRVGEAFDRFKESRFAEIRPIMTEAPFTLVIDEARISGRIDAIYESTPGSWEIVDFKSGRRRSDDRTRVQLEAYALAVADAGLGARTPTETTVTFVYLGDGVDEVTESVDAPWLEAARTHVAELLTGATGGTYPEQPSNACRSCDFVRYCGPGTAWMEEHG